MKKPATTNLAKEAPTHFVVPDTQVRPGVPTDHLRWIGEYIWDQFHDRPNFTVVHLGDHWDMPSLSSYDRGKRAMEGRRYADDIEAGNEAFRLITAKIDRENAKRRRRHAPEWLPRLVFLTGNHEYRIERAAEDNAQLEGTVSLGDLDTGRWEVIPFLVPFVLDGVAYCLTPDHKALMSDLSYKPLGELVAGDRVRAFTEHCEGRSRRYVDSTVLAADPCVAPIMLVTLASGKTFRATADHRWLAKRPGTGYQWVHTNDLRPGSHSLSRPLPVWEQEDSYEAGWLGGLFDGEGHVSRLRVQGGIQLGVSQNPGLVLDRILSILDGWGVRYDLRQSGDSRCMSVRIRGNTGDKLALLGRIGAIRLLAKAQKVWAGRIQTPSKDTDMVASVEPAGLATVMQVSTDSGTLIVDGYAHHNCHYFANPMTGRPFGGMIDTRIKQIGRSFTMGHQQGLKYGLLESWTDDGRRTMRHGLVAGSCSLHDETYMGPQGNAYWRGVIVCHGVEDGSYDPMMLRLDYLCRRYEGVRLAEFMPGLGGGVAR